jgi:arsenate reductase
MAEGIARHLFGDAYAVYSAGTHPSVVHPLAIRAMNEIGIDISGHRSKSISEFLNQPFDYIITVCGDADQACPAFPGSAQRIHWGFDDPARATGTEEERLVHFRRVRDEIKRKFQSDGLKTLV